MSISTVGNPSVRHKGVDVVAQSPPDVLEQLLFDRNIIGNDEQEQAVRMVAEHRIARDPTQLLLYIAGEGGTGKSHVINTIAEFFEKTHSSEQLLISAPTGIAAVLIKGYTIHALTFLPKT
ncbi:hypothetical protein BV25DRAFT_1809163, partial [Artomyces pyxidatus]